MAFSVEEQQQIRDEFRAAVNLQPAELERWLQTEQSQSVGATPDGAEESVGHQSGRRIVALQRMKQADYTDDDYAHMRKVVGYVHRHLAQRPQGEIEDSRWRHSLMNWGHDPLRD